MSEHHNCGGCGGCGSKSQQAPPPDPILASHPLSQIKTVIGIGGGKGGTGKSLVTGLLAVELAKKGHKIAILDGDILSPAIPCMFYLPQGVTKGEEGLYPAISEHGIKVMSISHLLEQETDTVTWHSAVMAGILQQLWTNVVWDKLDYLFIDLPPGTGDVTLTVLEKLPLDGVIVVSTPQTIVNQAAERTIRLSTEHQVPVLGLIENFNGHFGGDATEALASRYQIPLLDRLPFDPILTDAADEGKLESLGSAYLPKTTAMIERL
ncbi:MAG: Mrp/NBP35 family ATP-binding protein [Oscillospiraceae bacterium]|nr:Mrp/NBP35 family ATP-binding protein [Oscillospiraceae bacterium]